MERVEVGIRELRLNLSRYVARVRDGGAEVIVTDRGRPVARLGPVDDEQREVDEVFERLVREGVIIPGHRRRKRPLPPLVDASEVHGSVSELLLEDRR
jgi:prevent-host-death family protein